MFLASTNAQDAAQTILLWAALALGAVFVWVALRAGSQGLVRFLRGNAGEVMAAMVGGTLLGGLVALALGATFGWALLIGVSVGVAFTLIFVANV